MHKNTQTILTNDNSGVNVRDRGFNYGDGFFTTAKVVNGVVQLWALHKSRLIECASRLDFPEIDFAHLEARIGKYIATQTLCVLKIVITRGLGGRGYASPKSCHLTIVLTITQFPEHYHSLQKTGISLGVSNIKLASQPLLAGLKTLNRLEQVLIKNDMKNVPYDDVLVCDQQNQIIEVSAANIFIIKDSIIYSPLLNECGINGVYLRSLCDKLLIQFKTLSLNDVLQADGVFICNSLMEVVAVNCILDCQFNVSNSVLIFKQLLAKESQC
ncbi:aminodeoxychorismate lyase [Pseudoalteromonas sp. MMG010]|uniref:aminodeoxychorismate lyase n=1 Tax=Pseudoalteromonas sp. MMG010 TaxID=2822685 RepID=UPI001B3A5753|nr:aminodeoxychorismate lyase [Pseudoalteromonas sp. MMG010]MBQ4832527.1 aminodeoxychorismate lyase [Pseudoalteromonas sp. MMG010]